MIEATCLRGIIGAASILNNNPGVLVLDGEGTALNDRTIRAGLEACQYLTLVMPIN